MLLTFIVIAKFVKRTFNHLLLCSFVHLKVNEIWYPGRATCIIKLLRYQIVSVSYTKWPNNKSVIKGTNIWIWSKLFCGTRSLFADLVTYKIQLHVIGL